MPSDGKSLRSLWQGEVKIYRSKIFLFNNIGIPFNDAGKIAISLC